MTITKSYTGDGLTINPNEIKYFKKSKRHTEVFFYENITGLVYKDGKTYLAFCENNGCKSDCVKHKAVSKSIIAYINGCNNTRKNRLK